jgi:cobalt-zinc-cadmium efflux system membrane fusion protein
MLGALGCKERSHDGRESNHATREEHADEHGEHDEHGEGGEHGEHGEGGEHGEHGEQRARTVRISPEAIERMGVRVSTVEAIPLVGGIDVPAEIQAESNRLAHVSSVVSGQLARVTASVGDRVEAGQTLAVIRSVELGEARAQAARAGANVEVALANFRRQEELQREGIGSERQFLEAQAELKRAQAEQSAAGRALEVYGRGGSGSEVIIKSPIAGRVTERHATMGEVVAPSDVLFQVTDIARVWAVGRVYQQNAGQVHEGARATLTLQAYPGRAWQGQLEYVAPTLDERTRTLAVRMVLDNPGGELRPGLFGTLSISPAGGSSENVPVIRADALQRLGDDLIVFVPVNEQGEFRAVSVATGERSGGLMRVLSGLSVNERYVSEGGFVLKSELQRGELGEGHAH